MPALKRRAMLFVHGHKLKFHATMNITGANNQNQKQTRQIADIVASVDGKKKDREAQRKQSYVFLWCEVLRCCWQTTTTSTSGAQKLEMAVINGCFGGVICTVVLPLVTEFAEAGMRHGLKKEHLHAPSPGGCA